MPKARRLPSGSWNVTVYAGIADGKRKYESFTAETRREAEKQAADFAAERERTGKLRDRPDKMTLNEAVLKFVDDRSNVLSPSTIRGYKQILAKRLAVWKDVSLDQLSQDKLQNVVNELASRHSPKTVRNAYGLVKSVLREYRPDFHATVRLPQRGHRAIVIPSTDEIITMLLQGDAVERLTVMLGAYCGLRRSEMCALRLGDIDAEKHLIRITRATVQNDAGKWVVKPPKSFAGNRTIEVHESVVDAVMSVPRKSDAVFDISPCAVEHKFRRFARGLQMSFTLHSLRHYYVSVLHKLNVPNQYAMARTGHATPDILTRVYQHTMREERDLIAERVNAFFDGLQNEMQNRSGKNEENKEV